MISLNIKYYDTIKIKKYEYSFTTQVLLSKSTNAIHIFM